MENAQNQEQFTKQRSQRRGEIRKIKLKHTLDLPAPASKQDLPTTNNPLKTPNCVTPQNYPSTSGIWKQGRRRANMTYLGNLSAAPHLTTTEARNATYVSRKCISSYTIHSRPHSTREVVQCRSVCTAENTYCLSSQHEPMFNSE